MTKANHSIFRVSAVSPFLASETKPGGEKHFLEFPPMDRNDAGHPSAAHYRRMSLD